MTDQYRHLLDGARAEAARTLGSLLAGARVVARGAAEPMA
jgi:hypothetical protein